MHRIRDILLQDVAVLLQTSGQAQTEARGEVQTLLQTVLGVPRAYLLAHPEYQLSSEQHAAYSALLLRRLQGEPLAYILGMREFFGLNFKVTPDTLIPRADTELLVEQALQRIPPGVPCRVLDLGTGSGAIALSIAYTRPDIEVTAVDASGEALRVAQENAQHLGVKNIRLMRSDWFSALTGEQFDVIVSNPPYIADGDVHLQQGDLRFEPPSALASGAEGLDDIRCIIAQAGVHLCKGGVLMLEHGYDQAHSVRILLQLNGFMEIVSHKDLAGIERVSAGRLGR